MTLFEWGALGELVGGVAIIVSLIYVGLQIKQNTNALKLNTAHNTVEELADLLLNPAQHADLATYSFGACRIWTLLRVPNVFGFTATYTNIVEPMKTYIISICVEHWSPRLLLESQSNSRIC